MSTTDTLSREAWIEAVARGFARTMPDEFPEGFARHMAEDRARRGAYEAYLAGAFGDDLYQPNAKWA